MTGENELNRSHGSRLSLRGFFHSSSTSLSKEDNESNDKSQPNAELPSVPSHRLFLKQRDSRGGSISPQSSQSSLSSLMRKARKGENTNSIRQKNDSPDTQNNYGDHYSPSIDESNQHDYSNESLIISELINSSINDSVKKEQASSPQKHNAIPATRKNDKNDKNDKNEKHNKHEKNKKHEKHKNHDKHGSHLSLKRFLKKFKHNDEPAEKNKSKHSIFPHSYNGSSEIVQKYGPIGKFLGSGATGSVSLVTDKYDVNKIYAIKKFRPRFKTESESNYKSKVKNEFEVGFKLRHENIIFTKELIKEHPKILSEPEYYIIMEYCPFDFFNLVMSGLMTNNEKFCYFKQIINGVAHLHSHGLAHRDLKLDNCVVNAHGILKLIDFGSSVYFKKQKVSPEPTDDDIDSTYRLVRARGVVGSDPYLSPEVLEPSNFGYDPRAADVWSIAIIFCCMVLRRFPWKIPKLSDPSYKSFLGYSSEVKNSDSDLSAEIQDMKLKDKNDSAESTTDLLKGSRKLLRLLPSESHDLILKMLILDPTKRYLMEDVTSHEFYFSINVCRQGSLETTEEKHHVHHLITEEELKELQMKKEREKKLKEAGLA